jgi:hypothetical protein
MTYPFGANNFNDDRIKAAVSSAPTSPKTVAMAEAASDGE